ncbi:MAG TPA: hypothetical protein VF594_11120, partial [Rubricoccaceae bacterium]
MLLVFASGCRADRAEDVATDSDVLSQATSYLDTGRPQRAARLLRPYTAGEGATLAPEARLLAARTEAGVGDWERVRTLLGGAGGPDSLGGAWGVYLLARAHDETGDLGGARAGYEAFLSAANSSEMGLELGVARLRRALVLVRLDPEAGGRALDEVTEVPSDWRAVLEAEALAQAGDAERVEVVAGRYTSGPLGLRAWTARIEAARRGGDLGAARDLADRARAGARSDAARAAFTLAAGRLANEAGDRVAARAHLRAAIDAAPGSAAAREAAALLRRGDLEADDWLALARTDRALGL